MSTLTSLLTGALLALLLIFLTRRRPSQNALRIYAVGLIVAASIYLGFAFVRGTAEAALIVEASGLTLFGALAAIAVMKRSDLILATGWAAHILWDVALHRSGTAGAVYTPEWYPWLCVSFDLVIAAAILEAIGKSHGE